MIKTSASGTYEKERIKKSSELYKELHDLWLDTEEYLSYNRIRSIKKVDENFYNYLRKNRFSDEFDCWSIVYMYGTSKYFKPRRRFGNFKIEEHYDSKEAFVLKRRINKRWKVVAIRNTEKQIREVYEMCYKHLNRIS